MKLIYRIARIELNTLFYSPIAWIVLIIFTLQTGNKFTDLMDLHRGMLDRGRSIDNLTSWFFSWPFGDHSLLQFVKSNLYLYIPLLTMGLISRELSSGSIKLLLSSPVNFFQMVLGKYSSMVVYSFILCSILGVFTLAGGYSIRSFDYMLVLSGITGLFLLICSYSAIGLFISSLTSYQMVAAIGTFAVIGLLNFIDNLWQEVPVINEIAYWLSMSGRTDQMISGLISSKGVLYFFIVILSFITLTILKLSLAKQSTSLGIKICSYVAVLMVAITLGYITSRPSVTIYFDASATKKQTITQDSQKIVAQLNDYPLKITSYVNIFSPLIESSGTPKHHNQNFRQLENYIRFLPQLEMDYVYFYDTIPGDPGEIYKDNPELSEKELAQKVATSFGIDFKDILSPSEIKKVVDLSKEDNHYIRQIEYNGKKTFLRMFFDLNHYPLQEEISSALKRLTVDPPNVAFVSGHGERTLAKNDLDYRSATIAGATERRSLINKGFDFTTVTLETDQLAHDVTILVIADPKQMYTQEEIRKVKQYIDSGGNMLIMAEPDNRANLDSIVSHLGIKFIPGQLRQENEDFSPDFILGKVPKDALMLSKSFSFKNHIEKRYSVSVPTAMALKNYDNSQFQVTPLVVTDKKTSNELKDTESDQFYKLTSFESSEQAAMPIILALNRRVGKKEQRIIVAGDADFMNNREWARRNVSSMNRRQFIPNLFRWLSNDEFPVNAEYPPGEDNQITISAIGSLWFHIFFQGIMPGLILVFGAVLLILRKRK
ncbi:MAG: Gldg family protein [Cytophagales bacterium]|nr:Gldg family protein [Cytophagales bacterium]